MQRFEQFLQSVDALCERNGGKEMSNWLTSQDVCMILNISKRTLQTMRDRGKISYSQIGRMMYYKPEDVQKLVGDFTEKGASHE